MRMNPSDLLLGVVVTIIWGSNFSVIELGLDQLDPFLLTALRFTFSAFPLVLIVKRPADVKLVSIAAYGVVFGVGLWWVVNMAMHLGMSPGLSSLILQFSAFFTIILSSLLFRERISRVQIAGMVVAASGLAMIIHLTRGTTTTSGVVLVLLAAASWSVCNMIIKACRPRDMIAFIAWSSAFAAPVLFALTWVAEGNRPFVGLYHHFGGAAAFSVFFQAYVTTVFGYMVWNNLMKKYPAAMVAPLSLIVPISGLITSYLAFDEHLSGGMWIAIATVLGGIAIFINSGRIPSLFTRSHTA